MLRVLLHNTVLRIFGKIGKCKKMVDNGAAFDAVLVNLLSTIDCLNFLLLSCNNNVYRSIIIII